MFSSIKAFRAIERRIKDDSLMLATICDDRWNLLKMQHTTPNSKRTHPHGWRWPPLTLMLFEVYYWYKCKVLCTLLPFLPFDSLWPNDTIWWHRSGLTLAQLVAGFDLTLKVSCGIHLRSISQVLFMNFIHNNCALLNLLSHVLRVNELNPSSVCYPTADVMAPSGLFPSSACTHWCQTPVLSH